MICICAVYTIYKSYASIMGFVYNLHMQCVENSIYIYIYIYKWCANTTHSHMICIHIHTVHLNCICKWYTMCIWFVYICTYNFYRYMCVAYYSHMISIQCAYYVHMNHIGFAYDSHVTCIRYTHSIAMIYKRPRYIPNPFGSNNTCC